MQAFISFFKVILRLLIVWFIDTLSLFLVAWTLQGMTIASVGGVSRFGVAAAAALMLGVVNLLIRPVILLISIPLGFVVVFLAGFLVNAVTLLITSHLIPGFTIDGFWTSILGGLLLGIVNTAITTVITIDDSDSL